MDYCQERCYGRSWHGYLLAHIQSFLFPSSSSFLSLVLHKYEGRVLFHQDPACLIIVTVTLLWLDIVIMLSEISGMVYFLTSAVLFLWFSLLDEAYSR